MGLLPRRLNLLALDVKPVFLKARLYLSPRKWGEYFINKLPSITNKQWVFCSNGKHCKVDSLTRAKHQRMFGQVKALMYTNPDEVLPHHTHLLEKDIEVLAEGPAMNRQL